MIACTLTFTKRNVHPMNIQTRGDAHPMNIRTSPRMHNTQCTYIQCTMSISQTLCASNEHTDMHCVQGGCALDVHQDVHSMYTKNNNKEEEEQRRQRERKEEAKSSLSASLPSSHSPEVRNSVCQSFQPAYVRRRPR